MNNSFVVDNGSDTLRIGYAGDKKPKKSFLNFYGTPTQKNKVDKKSVYIGNQMLEEVKDKENMEIYFPLKNGIIQDFGQMKTIWEKSFKSVGTDEGDVFFMSDKYDTPKEHRQKMTEFIFEEVSASMFYLMKTHVMAMYSTGVQNGLVLNCGNDSCESIAAYESFTLKKSIQSTPIGGAFITKSILENDLLKSFSFFDKTPRDIKEKLCYISPFSPNTLEKFKLPDGNSFELENPSQFTECLFKGLPDSKNESVQEIIEESLNSLGRDEISNEFARNIILTGGSTLFQGFNERLHSELKSLNKTRNYEFVKVEDKINATWMGGSVASSLETFKMLFITKQEYQETGSMIINKCI
jgi:actin-related protein